MTAWCASTEMLNGSSPEWPFRDRHNAQDAGNRASGQRPQMMLSGGCCAVARGEHPRVFIPVELSLA